jgi:hypothetical protein
MAGSIIGPFLLETIKKAEIPMFHRLMTKEIGHKRAAIGRNTNLTRAKYFVVEKQARQKNRPLTLRFYPFRKRALFVMSL